MLLPGRLHSTTYDPEGILCTISASFMTLSGVVTGEILSMKRYSGNKKTIILTIAGIVLLITGIILSSFYPLIKRIWTSTYNLAASGICLLLMALFYWVIDVMNIQKWTFFFKVIGLNSITIYMLNKIINFEHISEFFLRGIPLVTGIDP